MFWLIYLSHFYLHLTHKSKSQILNQNVEVFREVILSHRLSLHVNWENNNDSISHFPVIFYLFLYLALGKVKTLGIKKRKEFGIINYNPLSDKYQARK